MKAEYWFKEKNANLAEEQNVSILFVTPNTNPVARNVWLLDSRCSNHMTGVRELFEALDET